MSDGQFHGLTDCGNWADVGGVGGACYDGFGAIRLHWYELDTRGDRQFCLWSKRFEPFDILVQTST